MLLVLIIACMSVGTLVYARTATREGEIAVRSALGASRGRIIGQLFVEALVLASVAAAVGLIAADRAVTWGIERRQPATGGAPFWITPGLKLSTILYAGGLAVVSAAMLSFLPALKVTRARVQPHLANLGAGGATLRFGRVWTGAMIVQVALTAMGIPVALESASQAMRKRENPRSNFPAESISPLASMWTGRSTRRPRRRSRRGGRGCSRELERRIAQEPGVVAVTFADSAPGSRPSTRVAEVESSPGAEPAYDEGFGRRRWARDSSRRSIVRSSPGVRSTGATGVPAARTMIVNEAFARAFSRDTGSGSPIGARLRYPASGDPTRHDGSPPPLKLRRTSGSRSSASCATSAWTLTTRATRSRMCFTRRRRERCLRS